MDLASIDELLNGELRDPVEALERVAQELERGIMHPNHPRYFGLFNPATAALAVIGDALASAENPQLATRSHAPWPVAVEERLVAEIGQRFGIPAGEGGGAFTSGGGEANLTALTCALARTFPEVHARGLRSLSGSPRVYVSAEGHATVARAAKLSGLGSDAVVRVTVDAHQRMKPAALAGAMAEDRAQGALPFLVVATVGTTSSGAIDPLPEIARVAERERCWLHVDAAWGGLAALVPELRPALAGIELADSITFDAHKVLSAPMGTGMYLTRHASALHAAFSERTGYMPKVGSSDPYGRSIQWSRRFLGLRVLLPLASLGFQGFAASLRRQVELAEFLRKELRERAWKIVNDTPLPLVCFVDASHPGGDGARFLDAVARHTLDSRGGFVSVPRFAQGGRALRACVNNHRTEGADIQRLLAALDVARARARNEVE